MEIADEALVTKVLGLVIEVHKNLGPGLLESIYEDALAFELKAARIRYERQVPVAVRYKTTTLGIGFRADLIVDKSIVLELKTVEQFMAIHTAQLITYLKLTRIKRGYLLNFNSALMKNGIKRVSI